MRKTLLALLATLGAALWGEESNAARLCNVAPEKKQAISAILCGWNSPDIVYRFEGPGCVNKSASRRMDDSITQVLGYRLCGDPRFAERLLFAHRKATEFIEALAPCASEEISTNSIIEDSSRKIEAMFLGHSCSASLRNSLEKRRPYFQEMIDQSERIDQREMIFEKLKVKMESDGTIVDR